MVQPYLWWQFHPMSWLIMVRLVKEWMLHYFWVYMVYLIYTSFSCHTYMLQLLLIHQITIKQVLSKENDTRIDLIFKKLKEKEEWNSSPKTVNSNPKILNLIQKLEECWKITDITNLWIFKSINLYKLIWIISY